MPAGIEIYNYVTNQKGSPAIWSDLFAARPPAGFIGRLFVSTNTFEIYRDNGITWDLISGGGGPSVNIYNSDGTLTGTRVVTMAGQNLTFEGGASTARIAMSANNNVPRIFSFRTAGLPRWAFRIDGNETGSNIGGDFALRAYNDAGVFTFSPFSVERRTGEKSFIANETLIASNSNLTGVYNLTTATMINAIALSGGNPQAASHNNFTVINTGGMSVGDSVFFGAQSNVLRLQSALSGCVTFTQSTGIRTAAASLNQVQYDTSNGTNCVYTHVAVSQNLGIYQLSSLGTFTINNGYSHLLNDLNEYGNLNITITNRWGIYQNSVFDVNYLGGTTLIGTTVNSGFKLDISGTLRNTLGANFATISGNVGIGTLTPSAKLDVRGSNPSLYVAQTGTLNGAFLSWDNSNANVDFGSMGGSWPIRIIQNNIVKMIMTSTGDIGINTLSPAFKLDVNGTIRSVLGAAFATTSGSVGIGTITPGAKLDIVGDLRINSSMNLVPTTTVPSATAGTLYYDSATNKLKLHDGTSFVNLN